MAHGLVRLLAAASAALLLTTPALAPPAFAQSEAQMEGAMREAAKDATRDFERAMETAAPIDAPEWSGTGPAPIETYIARPALSHVVMSPDGKYVAAARREKGATYLILVGLDGAGSKSLQLVGMSVSEIQWGANDRILYIAGADRIKYEGSARGIVMVGAPRMYSIGLDLREPVMFFENDKRLSRENLGVEMLPTRITGDPRHVLMEMRIQFQLNLLKVDVYDGSWEIVGQGEDETIHWFADSAGRPAIRFDVGNRRGTAIDVMVRQGTGNGARGIWTWKKAQTIRRDPDSRTSNTPDFQPLAPGPSPTQYYVQARSVDDGTVGVYLYDIDKAAIVQTIFSKDNADASGVVFDPDTGAYSGAVYWDERLKFEFTDPAMNKLMAGLDESFGHAWNIEPVSRSTGNKRWLIRASSATSLGGYYIYDVDNKSAREIGVVQPALQKVAAAQVMAASYTARDGLKINAYVTMPPSWTQTSPKPPLIVMPHGGPEVRDVYEYDPFAQLLASRGYAVLQPNFRGSAGYGKAFQDAGRGHWGDAAMDDLADGVKLLVDNGFADPARVCIYGASYGGYAAMMSIVRHPDLYKCAVGASGPTDLMKMLAWERKEEGSDSPAFRYWVSQMGDPGKDKAMIEAASPALHVDKIKVPVLLIHGKKDHTVPYEQTEFMRDALKKAGKPVEVVTFDYSAHGFSGKDLKRFLSELETFFGKHLDVTPVPVLP